MRPLLLARWADVGTPRSFKEAVAGLKASGLNRVKMGIRQVLFGCVEGRISYALDCPIWGLCQAL